MLAAGPILKTSGEELVDLAVVVGLAVVVVTVFEVTAGVNVVFVAVAVVIGAGAIIA